MKNNDFKESAPAFTKRLIDRRVEVNSTVRLSCQVHGLPVPSVSWYKDNRPVDFAGNTYARGIVIRYFSAVMDAACLRYTHVYSVHYTPHIRYGAQCVHGRGNISNAIIAVLLL